MLLSCCLLITVLVLSLLQSLSFLHMLQLESYQNAHYARWCREHPRRVFPISRLLNAAALIVAGCFVTTPIATDMGLTMTALQLLAALFALPAWAWAASLALGGFVSALALMLDIPLILVIVGFIYAAEVLSVVLQVGYFKATHGKRLFKMAPIHHHFELSGWKETKVVSVFVIITAILCLVGYLAL